MDLVEGDPGGLTIKIPGSSKVRATALSALGNLRGFLAVLVFAVVKEFIIDIFGKEHDSFLSSLKDFTFYMVGAAIGIVVAIVK